MRAIVIVIFFAFFAINTEAQDFSKVEITPQKINDHLYVLTGAGGNIGVCTGSDGLFMIDDQFAPLGDKIKAALVAIGGSAPKYLVNTHWHGDHTGGNEYFSKEGALIIAHENVRVRKSTDQLVQAFGREVPAAPEAAWPVITFSEELSLHINGEDILLFHVHHAHTDGDAIVYFPKSNVIHMGDIYFQATFPFIDISSGGSIDGVIKAINRVLFLVDEETIIIPGHGNLSNRTELIAYRDMLHTLRTRMKQALDAEMSIEEIKSANLTAEFNDRWGQGWMKPDTFIDIIYTDLSREEPFDNQ